MPLSHQHVKHLTLVKLRLMLKEIVRLFEVHEKLLSIVQHQRVKLFSVLYDIAKIVVGVFHSELIRFNVFFLKSVVEL